MTLSRPSFFPLAAVAFAATTVSRKAWASASLPTGIQLYTVNADLMKDTASTLKKIAGIGYTEVEIAGFGKMNAAQFPDLLHDAGLRAPSGHLTFGMQETRKLLEDVANEMRQAPSHLDEKRNKSRAQVSNQVWK